MNKAFLRFVLVPCYAVGAAAGAVCAQQVRGGYELGSFAYMAGSPAGASAEDAGAPMKGVWTARIRNRAVLPGTVRHLSPPGAFYQPMMHPEGTSVVFWGRKEGAQGVDIWISSVDGSRLRQLTTDGAGNEAPAWHPDGRRIVWCSARGTPATKPQPYHIWIMDADGRNQRQLTGGPWSDGRPCASPDGETIVFCSNRSGGTNLWRTDLTGSPPAQITKHDGRDWKPAFSPDGRYLAYFTDQSPTGNRTLAVLTWPDGPTVQPVAVTGKEWIHGPFWSSDGRHVLVHGQLMGSTLTRLYLVDVRRGEVEPFEVPGFETSGHGSWDLKETVMAFDGKRGPAPEAADR